MPLYSISHAIPLTPEQKDTIATAITHIHSQSFTTPKNFVNVKFIDVSEAWTYIGGRRKTANHILGNVRAGPTRTQEDWTRLCKAIERAWYDIVGAPPEVGKTVTNGATNGHANGTGSVDTTLRSVVVIGGIITGLEAGFVLPPAGGDVQWLHDNWDAFNEKAKAGDEEFIEMVKEVKERGLLDGEAAMLKAQQKQLEEMLGWGDSA